MHKIPTMVSDDVLKAITDMASKIQKGSCIVEVGAWLGACTAAACQGADDKEIIVYDRFRPSATEIRKAALFDEDLYGVSNTMEIVRTNIKPHVGNNRVKLHKTEILDIEYTYKKPIGLYIDDASKQPKLWNVVTEQFFPYLIPGAYVVLLDYLYFQTTESQLHRCQYEYMQDHPEFEMLDILQSEPHARVFRYNGR